MRSLGWIDDDGSLACNRLSSDEACLRILHSIRLFPSQFLEE